MNSIFFLIGIAVLATTTAGCGSTASSSPAIDAGDAVDASADDDASGGDDASVAVVTADAAAVTYTANVTFYGWDDNSPPGNAIAYAETDGFPTVHDTAGGTGTFADPLTLASDQAEIPVGTRVYLAFIEKYAIMEDDCTECDSDWAAGMQRHVDVWMNSTGAENATDLSACEDQWTQSAASIELNPPDGLPVTTSPLFDPSTNACRSAP